MSATDPKIPPPLLDAENRVAVWRESLSHLRHLSNDVTKCWTLFLTLNSAITLSISITLLFAPPSRLKPWIAVGLCVAGLSIALAGRYLFKRHRVYYLQMLAKKTLLEEQLGCYAERVAG